MLFTLRNINKLENKKHALQIKVLYGKCLYGSHSLYLEPYIINTNPPPPFVHEAPPDIFSLATECYNACLIALVFFTPMIKDKLYSYLPCGIPICSCTTIYDRL